MRKTIILLASLLLLQGCINMNNEYLDIANFFSDQLSIFSKSNPNEKIYTIFLGVQPIYGRITINLDTKENSIEQVTKWEHKGPAWYGEDKYGKYNNSSADFKYPFFNEMIISDWEKTFWNAVSNDSNKLFSHFSANLRTIDSRKVLFSWTNDHEYNEFYFNQLLSLFEQVLNKIDFSKYNMESKFRIGIQIFDDNLIKTWLIEVDSDS